MLLFALAPGIDLVEHRFCQAAEARLLRLFFGGPGDLMEQQLHQLLQHLGLLPKDVKGLVENLPVLATFDEHRMKRPVEVLARAERPATRGIEGIEYVAWPDREPRLAQHAREVHDVDGKLAGRAGIVRVGGDHAHGRIHSGMCGSPDLGLDLIENTLGFRAFHPDDVVLVFEEHA